MPVERKTECPECGQMTTTPVVMGLTVRHRECHLKWLRKRWVLADEPGKKALEEIALCVTRDYI